MHLVYLSSLVLASSLMAQDSLPLVTEVDSARLSEHLQALQRGLTGVKTPLTEAIDRAIREVKASKPGTDNLELAVQKILDPQCLAGVSINPESRVKAARGPLAADLTLGQSGYWLIKVHNDAGVTHPLGVAGPGLFPSKPNEPGSWLEAEVVAPPPLQRKLSGLKVEYVLLKLTAKESGKREATLRFDVGQGTQDLGFRAEVPILFTVRTR